MWWVVEYNCHNKRIIFYKELEKDIGGKISGHFYRLGKRQDFGRNKHTN